MSVISFIYSRKRTGPRTEPWGTPDMTFAGDESLCHANECNEIFISTLPSVI